MTAEAASVLTKTPEQNAGARNAGSNQIRVEVVNRDRLRQYREEWAQLSTAAIVPNPFYEPWMLLPAVENIADEENLHFVLILGPRMRNGADPLWGLFPIEIRSKCLGLPIRTMSFWQHRYCFLAVPSISASHAWDVLDAFWRWFEQNPFGCRLLDTNYLLAEGPFHALWADFAIGRSAFVVNEYPRALEVPEGTFDSYTSELISSKHRRSSNRNERYLREMGAVSYEQVDDASEVDAWATEFLDLEASGWKGTEGGAMAKSNQDSAFFREILRKGFPEGRVWLTSLRLDRRPVAMRVAFLACGGAFIFKMTYDESYSKYSPGMLLALQTLRWIFEQKQIRYQDTCAAPRHPLFEMTANRRRMIRRTLFSDGSRMGDFYASILPLLRCIKHRLRRTDLPSHLQISTKIKAREVKG